MLDNRRIDIWVILCQMCRLFARKLLFANQPPYVSVIVDLAMQKQMQSLIDSPILFAIVLGANL